MAIQTQGHHGLTWKQCYALDLEWFREWAPVLRSWFQCSAIQSWSFWEGLEHGDSDLTHGLIHSHIHNLMGLLRSGESFEAWGLTGVSRSLGVSLLPGSLEVTAFFHYILLPLFLPHHRSTALIETESQDKLSFLYVVSGALHSSIKQTLVRHLKIRCGSAH